MKSELLLLLEKPNSIMIIKLSKLLNNSAAETNPCENIKHLKICEMMLISVNTKSQMCKIL